MRILISILQILLGLTFTVSGLAKCIDPSGTALKFTEYLLYFGMDFAVELTLGMAWVLSILEFIVGINLLLGTARIRTMMMASLLMVVFTPLTLWLAQTNAIQDCGCFGDALRLTNWETFVKNLLIVAALLCVWMNRKKMYQLFGRTTRAVYGYWAFGIAIWLCWLGTWREPWIDFRPFLPGVSIRETLADKQMNDEITYSCIYKRDGVEREFELDQLPDESEGWEFVSTIEHAPEQSSAQASDRSIPLDFYVKDAEGNIVTDQLLQDSSYLFLLLSPSLDEASEHDLDKIEKIYEYAVDQNYPFFCVTSNDPSQAQRWEERTGAEYSFLFTDAQIIETITRANPGIMLLHDGVICWKSRLSTLDDLPVSSAKLNEQTFGEIKYFRTRNHYFWLITLLFLPIVLPLCLEFTKSIKILTKKDFKNA